MKKKKSFINKEIQRVLDEFPLHIAQKRKNALARKKFLKDTFGDIVKLIKKMQAKKD